MPSSNLPHLIQSILTTLTTLRVQVLDLQTAILEPPKAPEPPSPDNTLLVPGAALSHITDSAGNTWSISPHPASAIPTLYLNGRYDPFAAPISIALYLNSTVYFQRLTGQWHQWITDHWVPSPDPRKPSSPDWGLPAHRAEAGQLFTWIPAEPQFTQLNYDLLVELFTDNGHDASTFLPGPIPIVTRPRGALPEPLVYQRSDNTFLIPIIAISTPITIQFPGLRPTFIRLWDVKAKNPARVVTGTDTIAVPSTKDSLHIIELSLG